MEYYYSHQSLIPQFRKSTQKKVCEGEHITIAYDLYTLRNIKHIISKCI